jgi:hypothetical protein
MNQDWHTSIAVSFPPQCHPRCLYCHESYLRTQLLIAKYEGDTEDLSPLSVTRAASIVMNLICIHNC